MAKKPTINNITAGFDSVARTNLNNAALRDAFDNTLSLDGSTPNAMLADFDLNSNNIINAGNISAATLDVAGIDITAQFTGAQAAATAAAASATSAANSASSASTDASTSATNASAAQTAQTAAEAAQSAAETAETNASTSETNAAASASTASTAATNAGTSETNAASSASAAATSAANAATSETNASASETAAQAAQTAAEAARDAAQAGGYDPTDVDFTGGTMDGVSVGATTPDSGRFTSVKGEGAGFQFAVKETDGTTTHNVTGLNQNADAFFIETRDDSDTYVDYDYRIAKGASGAVSHEWKIGSGIALDIDSNGKLRARNDARVDGDLSIGTASATYPLHVAGQAGIELFNGATSGNVLNFRPSLGDSNKYNLSISAYDHNTEGTGAADGLSINAFDGVSISTNSSTERSEKWRLTQAGRIGHNTSTPAVGHEMVGSTAANSELRVRNTATASSTFTGNDVGGVSVVGADANPTNKYVGSLKFGSTDANFTTTSPKFGAALTAEAAQTYSSDTNGGMDLGFWTSPTDPGTGHGLVQRMVVKSDGKVGIGTTAPQWNFSMEQPGVQVLQVESTDDNAVQFRMKSDSSNRRFLAVDNTDAVESQVEFGAAEVNVYGTTTDADCILKAPQIAGKWNIKYHGAVGNGSTDDSTAVSDAMDYVIDNGGMMEVPAGTFRLNSAISKTMTGPAKKIGIVGAGQGASEFLVPSSNTTGAFLLDATSTADRSDQAVFRDFSIEVQANGGTGLQFIQNPGGVQDLNTVICDSVRLWTDTTGSNYFSIAFDFSGAWRPLIKNTFWAGPVFGYDHTDGDPAVACQKALKLHDAYDPIIKDSWFKGARRAVDMTDVRGGNESEAVRIDSCVFNQCWYGLYWERSAREVMMMIDKTHINSKISSIFLDGIRFCQITNCLLYNEDDGEDFAGTPTDIFLKNAEDFIIKNNIFHFPGHSDRVGIFVDDDGVGNAGHTGIIKDNIFTGTFDRAIFLDTSTQGVFGDGNINKGTITTFIQDNGVSNNVT